MTQHDGVQKDLARGEAEMLGEKIAKVSREGKGRKRNDPFK